MRPTWVNSTLHHPRKRRFVCLNGLAPFCEISNSFWTCSRHIQLAGSSRLKKWRKDCKFYPDPTHFLLPHPPISYPRKNSCSCKSPFYFEPYAQCPQYMTLRGSKASSSQVWEVSKIWHVLDSTWVQINGWKIQLYLSYWGGDTTVVTH